MLNISAKTEYACIAVLELAMHVSQDDPVRIRDIADAHGIPSRFLVQILLQLKNAGIVSSTRGASGGYRLASAPDTVSLGDVMGAVEGKTEEIAKNASADTAISQTLQKVWQQIADQQQEKLDAVSIGKLAESIKNEDENMYYI